MTIKNQYARDQVLLPYFLITAYRKYKQTVQILYRNRKTFRLFFYIHSVNVQIMILGRQLDVSYKAMNTTSSYPSIFLLNVETLLGTIKV